MPVTECGKDPVSLSALPPAGPFHPKAAPLLVLGQRTASSPGARALLHAPRGQTASASHGKQDFETHPDAACLGHRQSLEPVIAAAWPAAVPSVRARPATPEAQACAQK